jgi:VWFA-related protein
MVSLHSPVRVTALTVLLASGGHAAGQQPRQEQQPFRTGVHAIEVDVRVFDKAGRFVTDLTRGDFEILENGEVQQLEALYLIGQPAFAAPTSRPPIDDDRAVPVVPSPATSRQTWIFVFDTNHLVPGAGFDRAKKAVTEFLRTRFKEGDVGGIVAGGKMLNNRLTSVREELVAAAEGVKPNTDVRSRTLELTREWPRLQDELEAILISEGDKDALQRAVIRACSDEPDSCRVVPPDMAVQQKARNLHTELERMTRETLTTVNALASGLAKMAGPKTLVLLSDGFVTERMETALQQAVGQTTRAGGRVYAIDVRGLNRGRGAGIIDQAVADDTAGAFTQFDALADGPNSLAVDTGGLMIRNENNIGRALSTVADDAGTYYVIGYRPTNQAFDGKFRQIQVRVKRPDVRVRARRGYLAIEPSRLLAPQPITSPTQPLVQSSPANAGEGAGAAVPPADALALPSVEPLPPVTAGKVVEGAATTSGSGMRLRPDAMDRVREIAGDSAKESGPLAAKGWAAYERGDVESAAVAFTEAAKQPDVRPWVLYTLGLSHVALARPSDAIAVWERVRTAAPEFDAVYIDLADAYLQMSEVTKALDVLREGSRRWPQDPEFHNAIGVIHVRRGAFDEGIQAFEQAAAAVPDEPLAYFNLGRAYQMRHARDTRYVASQRRWISPESDRKKAIQYYEQYLKLGGPYAGQAKEAIRLLEWAKR